MFTFQNDINNGYKQGDIQFVGIKGLEYLSTAYKADFESVVTTHIADITTEVAKTTPAEADTLKSNWVAFGAGYSPIRVRGA